MTTRKGRALGGLVLALAILSPASALADAGGTSRPVKGTISGTIALNVFTGAYRGDATGVATHLGEYTGQLEGTGTFLPGGTFLDDDANTTIVADNGDKLFGTAVATTTSTFDPTDPTGPDHTTKQETTITGGTGRFAHASGTLITTYQVTRRSIDLTTGILVSTAEGLTTGHVSY